MPEKQINRRKGEGMIFKKKGIKFYHFRYMINGKLKEISLNPATTYIEAEKEAKKYITTINAKTMEEVAFHVGQARNLIKKKNEIKLDELRILYLNSTKRKATGKTVKNHESILEKFITWINNNYPLITTINKVTKSEAEEYAIHLWNKKISSKTYNDHIEIIRMIIRITTNISDSDNPFNKNNIPKKTAIPVNRKEFSEEEVLNILNSFDQPFYLLNKDEMRVLFNIAAWTAQRLKDCCLLKWSAINFQTSKIHIIPSKTKRFDKPINIPIHPELLKYLITAQKWRFNDYVLPNTAERYERNPKGINNDIKKVLQINGFVVTEETKREQRKLKANLYGIHSFRHSFVTFCLNANIPISVIESIIGDGSPVIKKYYAHVGDKAVIDAYNILPGSTNIDIKKEIIQKINTATQEQLSKIQTILNLKSPVKSNRAIRKA